MFGKGLRYRVRYIGPDGKERKKSFPDRAKRDAEAFMVSVESDELSRRLRRSPLGASPSLSTPTSGSGLAFDESSRKSTEPRVRKHLLPFFGHRQLSAIKPGQIREWDRNLVGVLAPASRAVVFTHFRSILAAAVDDERIAKNPCSARSVIPPRAVQRQVAPWKPQEVAAVRANLPERYRVAVDLGAGCGHRQGEVLGLSVDAFSITFGDRFPAAETY